MKKIKLSQGKYALVDDADFEWLNQWKWCAIRDGYTFYAARAQSRKFTQMHRVITEAPKGKVVDHLNGSGLDNRRANLRVCTQHENMLNRHRLNSNNKSGIAGVTWHKTQKKWQAGLRRFGKKIYLGVHRSKQEAIKAVQTFVREE